MSLRYDEIAELMKIIDSSSCEEVIIETGDLKLVVRRNGGAGASIATRAAVPSADLSSASTPARKVAPSTKREPRPTPAKVQTADGQIEVVAPMVGTFYRSPAPDAPPFVEIGGTVRAGAPLCIIEVMKLFTTITSEHEGRVTEIGAENGDLVEYGRVLFVIESS